MKKQVYVSVSTDPISDFQKIIDYAKSLQDKADFLHCDVMDGQFVKNVTYDEGMIKSLNAATLLPLDVHLMTSEPAMKVQSYLEAGANILTVHYEAFKNKKDLLSVFEQIHEFGGLAGLSFKPKTKFIEFRSYLFYVDVALIMGVEPGESGQGMLESTIERLREICKFRSENKLSFKIEVDGGVNDKNAHIISEMGADILVSGSYVFNATDKEKAIKKLKK